MNTEEHPQCLETNVIKRKILNHTLLSFPTEISYHYPYHLAPTTCSLLYVRITTITCSIGYLNRKLSMFVKYHIVLLLNLFAIDEVQLVRVYTTSWSTACIISLIFSSLSTVRLMVEVTTIGLGRLRNEGEIKSLSYPLNF